MYEQLSKCYYKYPDEYEKFCIDRYNSISSYHLPVKISGHDAFFCATLEIINLTTKIYEKAAKISKIEEKLPPVALNSCVNNFLIDEILDTNDIEGVHSSRHEIKLALKKSSEDSDKSIVKFQGIAKKYSRMGDDNIKYKNCMEIRELYDELVYDEIEDCNKPDGSIFRKESTSVYNSQDKECHRGINPESDIIDYMEKSLGILNDTKIPILIRIAIFHYLFGYIHPFYDGNGRTSRFISSYIINKSLDQLLGYRLSHTIKQNKKKYEKAFDDCNDSRNYGDITSFIHMFLEIINISATDTMEVLTKLDDKLYYYTELLDNLDLPKQHKKIIYILVQNGLFENMPLDKEHLLRVLNHNEKISLTTLNNRLKSLISEYKLPIISGLEGHKRAYHLDIDEFETFCKSQLKE